MSFRRAGLMAFTIVHVISATTIAAAQTVPFEDEPPEFIGLTHQLTSAQADQPDVDERWMASDQGTAMEHRIAALERQLYGGRQSGGIDVLSTLDAQLEQQSRGQGGIFGSIEVTFLRPRVTGALPTFYFAGLNGRMIDPNYDPGVRYQLGYRTDSGLGIRGRYWSHDHWSPFVAPSVPAQMRIEMDVVDTEVTLAQNFRNWDLQVSGGVRYSRLQYTTSIPALLGIGTVNFEGVGPTASLEARRRLGTTGLALMGNVRGSLLMGDVRNASVLTTMPRGTIKDEITQVFENQLGIVWTHGLGYSWQLELKTAWETQFWLNDTLADDAMGFGSNLAFTGPTIAIELKY